MKYLDRRPAIIAYIADFHARCGYAPSYREIADGVGLASTEGVSRWLTMLRDEGRLAFVDGQPRTVRVVS